MKRNQRIISRQNRVISNLNETARLLDSCLYQSGIPDSDKVSFLKWTVSTLWDTFKTERMNRRLEIENEINNLRLRLPNGTVSTPYSFSFELPSDKVSDVEIEGAQGLGLSLISGPDGKFTVEGIPVLVGDYNLKLRFKTVEGEPFSEIVLPVAFNPDPKSLWNDIPTNPDIPYFKPDTETEYIKVEAGVDGLTKKDIVAASRRGRSHAREGKARDDHFGIFHCDDSDWYIMAVADGAGSARFSRKGSELACKTVIEHCRERLLSNPDFETAIREFETDRNDRQKRTELTRHIFEIVYKGAIRAHDAIKKLADSEDHLKLKDFATTLMFAICKKFDFGWFIASFWVGDGAVCLYDREAGIAKLLGTPDEGEFSGQTRFLTMPEIFHDPEAFQKRVRMTVVPDFTALFLMSDGVSDPMFETDRNLNDPRKWSEFFEKLKTGFPEDNIGGVDLTDDNEKSKDQLLDWLDFWSPGNHDDRTVAILY